MTAWAASCSAWRNTLAQRNSLPIKTVQENLGHHTAAFTLDVYAHVTAQMKTESANRMQNFISSIV